MDEEQGADRGPVPSLSPTHDPSTRGSPARDLRTLLEPVIFKTHVVSVMCTNSGKED